MILNYNGGENIRMCIESVRRNTPEDYELLVWDNGSTDGFREYLRKGPDITLIESPENIGIAARSHLMAKAKGDFLVFLDNDTVVTKGWLARFLLYGKGFKDCGIIGPRTNYASGYQQVQNINYASIDQLEQVAAAIGGQSRGMLTGISKMPSFCWFFPRAVMEKIGYIRTFGKFGFEDDDMCLRAAIAGFKNVVANDVYIHHTGGPQGRGDATYNQYMLDAWKGFKAVWDIEGNGVIGDGYHPDKIAEREFDPKKHFVAAPKSIQER
jgi:GT2 family glycosyltransferase